MAKGISFGERGHYCTAFSSCWSVFIKRLPLGVPSARTAMRNGVLARTRVLDSHSSGASFEEPPQPSSTFIGSLFNI